MKVVPVPVRDDNYAYLLIDDASNKAAAIDPYDVPKVQAAAEKAGVEIVAATPVVDNARRTPPGPSSDKR